MESHFELAPVTSFSLPPADGETILSYIVRIGAHNFYSKPLNLIKEGDEEISAGAVWDLSPERLSTRLKQPEAMLAPLVPHAMEDGGFRFGRRTIGAKDLLRVNRRVSPSGLRKFGTDRCDWAISPITFCPDTWELLIGACHNPECGAKLTWTARSIFNCEACGSDLRDAPVLKVKKEDRPALQLVLDLISSDPSISHSVVERMPARLQKLSPPDLRKLIEALGEAMCKARGQDVPSRSKHPSYPHKWLLGARAMLDASEIQALVQGELGRDVLVTFWASLKTRTATFKPQLNRALREFVGGAPHLANGCWVNVTKAANMLQIERSQVRQLIELGQLDSYPGEQIPDAKRRRDFISVESIEAIRRNRSSPSTFSAYYKIPKAVISELIELGRLSTLEHPTYDLLYKEPQLNAAVAQEFFDRASDALTATRRSLTAADIRSRVPVAWLLGRDRKDVLWAHLLCALVDGTIPGGLVNIAPSRFSFEGFTFHPDDATAVLEGNLKLVPRSAPPPPYARLEEVESELDIYPRDVQKLIGSGLLVRHEQGITRESLSKCAAAVVSTRELAGLTGFPTAELTTEAAARGVRRLWSGFGLWDRKIATTAFGLRSSATSDAA